MGLKVFVSAVLVLCLVGYMGALEVHAGQTGVVLEELTAEEAIINGCLNEQNVDISEYDLTPEELDVLFRSLHASGRLPWYTGNSYKYEYEDGTGLVLTFIPSSIIDSHE